MALLLFVFYDTITSRSSSSSFFFLLPSSSSSTSSTTSSSSTSLKRDPVQLGDLAQQNDLFFAQSLPVEELVVDEMTSPMQVSMQKSNERCPDTDSPKLTHEPCIDANDIEFSPRLSNYILSGVVPESPINYSGVPVSGGYMVPDLPKLHTELPEKSLQQNRAATNETEACIKNVPSLSKNKIQSPILHVEETRSPVEKSTSLQLNDEGMSESVEPKYKLKRLCKHGDLVKRRPPDCENREIVRSLNFTNSSSGVQTRGRELNSNIRTW